MADRKINFPIPTPTTTRLIDEVEHAVNAFSLANIKRILSAYHYYFERFQNLKHTIATNLANTTLNQGLYSFAANITDNANSKVFSDVTSHLIADTTVLGGMYYWGQSMTDISSLAISSGLKYLPNLIVTNLFHGTISEPINTLLTSNFTPFAFDLAFMAWGMYQGDYFRPLVTAKFAGDLAGLCGFSVGDKLGKLSAKVVNGVVHIVYDHLSENNTDENESKWIAKQKKSRLNGKSDETDESKQDQNININLNVNLNVKPEDALLLKNIFSTSRATLFAEQSNQSNQSNQNNKPMDKIEILQSARPS